MQHIGTKQLETERLILRRYRMQDANDMFANWVTDQEVTRFWDWEPHKDIATTQALLKQWIAEYDDLDYYHWVIVCKSNMQAIGYIYLDTINNSARTAAVHYLASRAYWNQGLMSEACKRVIEFAFHDVGFLKIHSYHHCDNPASGRVMQKCGMTFIKAEYRRMDNERLSGEYHYYEVENALEQQVQDFKGKVNILHLIEGAKQAKGLTVIIDVFRAFSLECYLYDMNVKEIRPVGTIEEAFRLKDTISDSILVGERSGKKCEGFDYGNSPSTIPKECVEGKITIHTTSAGTQGIVNASGANEIITGSLVNAKAVAEYILAKHPQTVSLVCMGNGGVRLAAEDELCAEYIKSILEGNELPDFEKRVVALRENGGEHFFDKSKQDIFPEEDFWMCIKYNQFPFVIRIEKDKFGFVARKEI